ncbi:MAG: CDP-diacylglycerol--glycerol-3-phosphate 3-phosphatidyltransferase [Azospirillaceae bacterium]
MQNLPNLLTLSRIAAIPVIVALFFVPTHWARLVATALFLLAAVTDFLDGYLARRMGIASPLGKLLDPIADKMLVNALLLMLAATGDIFGWHVIAAIAIVGREILVAGIREFLASGGLPGLPVSYLAKWKTTVQLAALAILIAHPALPGSAVIWDVGLGALWLSAALTVVTGVDYVSTGMRQIARPQPR